MGTRAGFMDADPDKRLVAIKLAGDHTARAHKGQMRKDKKTPYIIHPARVAGLVSMFSGTHIAVISAWLHDIYEDCTPSWVARTDRFIAGLPLPENETREIAAIVDAMTKKNTVRGKGARLTDSPLRIRSSPPEATLVKICDRIDNFLDSGCRNGEFTTRYLASTGEVIERLTELARLYGYTEALVMLKDLQLKKG